MESSLDSRIDIVIRCDVSYVYLLEAAAAGKGLALGWKGADRTSFAKWRTVDGAG